MQRVTALQQVEPYIGRFYSSVWVRKNLLMQTDEEIEIMDKEMAEDKVQQIQLADEQGRLAAVTQVAQQQHLMNNGLGGNEQSPDQQ
jgi:Na+-transporting methylmalonyl-CoA/oxaloacetate decarboxylase gamma subunit